MAEATTHLLRPLAAEVTARRRTSGDEVEEEALYICKVPSCAQCSDIDRCFGPES